MVLSPSEPTVSPAARGLRLAIAGLWVATTGLWVAVTGLWLAMTGSGLVLPSLSSALAAPRIAQARRLATRERDHPDRRAARAIIAQAPWRGAARTYDAR